MGKVKTILTAALAVILSAGCFVGCKDPDADLKRKATTMLSFWTAVSPSSDDVLDEVIDEFNQTNTYGIFVEATPRADSSGIGTQLAGSNPPDVVYMDDRYFKGYALDGYLAPLDDYVAQSELTDLDDFWPSTVDRFRFDPETGVSGGDSTLYALPFSNGPTVIYYNKTQFAEQKVNIISVAEDDLAAYNQANNTSYLPHGFYEYTTSPNPGDTSFMVNGNGTYYVFNNQIPMNWEELRECSRIFTKEFNPGSASTYGFMNEWWFSYGWSVGGDCLEWVSDPNGDGDTSDAQYMFSLGEQTPNYLVTGQETVTVNGHEYTEGELLSYDDKHYVEDHASDADIAAYLQSQQLYELPSIYDAFVEFCRLSQTTNRPVTAGLNGYGISPSPTTLNQYGKNQYFTSGRTAMICNGLSEAYTIGRSMAEDSWDIAPLYQYREYNDDGSYKTVNGTPIMGKKAAHNGANGYAIAANSRNKDAAWRLIEYMTSTDVQEKLIPAFLGVPCRISVAESDAFMTYDSRFLPDNKAALVEAADYCTVGDWSYVEDGEWINGWANVLNTSVRDGNMTLDQFFNDPVIAETNRVLRDYTAQKFNG